MVNTYNFYIDMNITFYGETESRLAIGVFTNDPTYLEDNMTIEALDTFFKTAGIVGSGFGRGEGLLVGVTTTYTPGSGDELGSLTMEMDDGGEHFENHVSLNDQTIGSFHIIFDYVKWDSTEMESGIEIDGTGYQPEEPE